MNWGAFLLDPLNLTGIQDTPQPARPAPAAPPPPPQGLQLDMSNPPPYGVTAGNADGRPERGYFQPGSAPASMKPGQGFLGSMMGQESPFKPGWSYTQGKGPQWDAGPGAPKGPFTGNRI